MLPLPSSPDQMVDDHERADDLAYVAEYRSAPPRTPIAALVMLLIALIVVALLLVMRAGNESAPGDSPIPTEAPVPTEPLIGDDG